MLFLVQEWLDTRNATAETRVFHASLRGELQSTLCESQSHNLEWVLCHNSLQSAVISIACALFSTTFLLSLHLSINVLGDRAL